MQFSIQKALPSEQSAQDRVLLPVSVVLAKVIGALYFGLCCLGEKVALLSVLLTHHIITVVVRDPLGTQERVQASMPFAVGQSGDRCYSLFVDCLNESDGVPKFVFVPVFVDVVPACTDEPHLWVLLEWEVVPYQANAIRGEGLNLPRAII